MPLSVFAACAYPAMSYCRAASG